MTESEMMTNLAAISEYFRICAGNAKPGTKGHTRFSNYRDAVLMALAVLERQEDDGK